MNGATAATGAEIGNSVRFLRVISFIKTLFIEGYVSGSLQQTPAIGGYLGKKGVRLQFVTRCVENDFRQRCVFHSCPEVCHRWGPCKPASERIRNVA